MEDWIAKWDFLNVDNLLEAYRFVLLNWDFNSNLAPKYNNELLSFLNVGSGKDILIKNLAYIFGKKCEYNG